MVDMLWLSKTQLELNRAKVFREMVKIWEESFFPKMTQSLTDKSTAQPKIDLQSFKSTPDSLLNIEKRPCVPLLSSSSFGSILSAWRMGPLILPLQATLSLAAILACLQVLNPRCSLSLFTVLCHVSLGPVLFHACLQMPTVLLLYLLVTNTCKLKVYVKRISLTS